MIERDSYIIVRYKNKTKLALVLNPKGRSAVLDDTLDSEAPVNFKYNEEDVLCWLGKDPQPGSSYGVKIEPFIRKIETKYGPISLFRKLKKGEAVGLKKGLKQAYALFEKHASTSFLPLHRISIRGKKGKYAGTYKAKNVGIELFDELTFHTADLSDAKYNLYLITHEFAHGLWYRCVSSKVKARWLRLYEKRMLLGKIPSKRLEGLFTEIVEYDGDLRSFIKESADDMDALILKEVLAYLKKYHGLAMDNVSLLFKCDTETIGEIWPTAAIFSDKKADVSKYATTKVEEFFAEAVAYYLCGQSLPKDVRQAVQKTFKLIKTRGGG